MLSLIDCINVVRCVVVAPPCVMYRVPNRWRLCLFLCTPHQDTCTHVGCNKKKKKEEGRYGPPPAQTKPVS